MLSLLTAHYSPTATGVKAKRRFEAYDKELKNKSGRAWGREQRAERGKRGIEKSLYLKKHCKYNKVTLFCNLIGLFV
jgi:hypothetical protein